MKTKGFLIIIFFVLVLAAGSVAAEPAVDPITPQVTITDGDATFSFTGAVSSGTAGYAFPNSTFSIAGLDVNGLDEDGNQLYQTWWWYRIAGESQESMLPDTLSSKVFSAGTPNTATLIWDNVDDKFSAELVLTITETIAGESATLRQDLTITNLADQPLEIDVFVFADIDAGGTFSGDAAELNTSTFLTNATQSSTAADTVTISDADSPTEVQFTSNFETQSAFAVDAWSNVSNQLTDDVADDFNNQALPFPTNTETGDFTSGIQHTQRLIPAGASFTYMAGVGLNTDAPTALNLASFEAVTGSNSFLVPVMILLLAVMTGALFVQSRRQTPAG